MELPVSGWWGPDKVEYGHVEEEVGRARQLHEGS